MTIMPHTNKTVMKKIFFIPLILLFVFVSCEKDDDPGEAPRLFRPVLKDQLVSNGNWIAAAWQPVTGAVSYTAQLSRDTFRTIAASMTIDTNAVLFENLDWDKLYQVQVKAIAGDTSKNSRISQLGAIKTARFPSILNIPGLSDINDN